MNGGIVEGDGDDGTHEAGQGGGVCIETGGHFIMNGDSIIRGNNVSSNGGGILLNGGTFDMNGGTIGGDDPAAANTANFGAGIYIDSGSATMSGTNTFIKGNNAITYGGGIHNSGELIMNGGSISANTSGSDGSGVFMDSIPGTVFRMQGAAMVDSDNLIYIYDSDHSIEITGALTRPGLAGTISIGGLGYAAWTNPILIGSAVSSGFLKFTLADSNYEIHDDGKIYLKNP